MVVARDVAGHDPAEITAARRVLVEAALRLADQALNPPTSQRLEQVPDARKLVALGHRLMRGQVDSEVGEPTLDPDPEMDALAADLIARVEADTRQGPLMILEHGIYLGVLRSFASQVVSDAVGFRPSRRPLGQRLGAGARR